MSFLICFSVIRGRRACFEMRRHRRAFVVALRGLHPNPLAHRTNSRFLMFRGVQRTPFKSNCPREFLVRFGRRRRRVTTFFLRRGRVTTTGGRRAMTVFTTGGRRTVTEWARAHGLHHWRTTHSDGWWMRAHGLHPRAIRPNDCHV